MKLEINAIVTGATGMVGEGVLYECLNDERIASVLVINRKPCGYQHTKLKEIMHENFFDFSSIASQLTGYNACFFCLGISSIGVSKETYYRTTYDLTMRVAKTLSELNPKMTFCYVSGAGTSTGENSRLNWANVKGKTENDLMKLPFAQVFNFRPGIIKPIPGLKYSHKAYSFFLWLFPILKAFNRNSFVSLSQLGKAMINTVNSTGERKIVDIPEIIKLANPQAS